MEGLSVVDVSEFFDGDGNRWRQITFSDRRVVQMLINGPWLVLEPEA
jgi:hypothetical protein